MMGEILGTDEREVGGVLSPKTGEVGQSIKGTRGTSCIK